MPIYTFSCRSCETIFEEQMSISEYGNNKVNCPSCNSKKIEREYILDAATISNAVRKSDSELKTIGDLANRNRDKLSDDQKDALHQKHNAYKEVIPDKPLPKGMSRIKKQPKIKWPNRNRGK